MRVPKKPPTWLPELLDFSVQQTEASDRSLNAVKITKKLIKTHYEAFATANAPPPKDTSKSTKKRKTKSEAKSEAKSEEPPTDPVVQFAQAMECLVSQPEVLQNCLQDMAVPFLTQEVTRLDEVLQKQQTALEQLTAACLHEPALSGACQQLQETCQWARQVCADLQRKTHQRGLVGDPVGDLVGDPVGNPPNDSDQDQGDTVGEEMDDE